MAPAIPPAEDDKLDNNDNNFRTYPRASAAGDTPTSQ